MLWLALLVQVPMPLALSFFLLEGLTLGLSELPLAFSWERLVEQVPL